MWAFMTGAVVVAAVLAPPLANVDHHSLTGHMVQHLVLMTLAAPLILLGKPEIVWRRRPRYGLIHRLPVHHGQGRTLFGDRPAAEVLMAFEGEECAGFALFFTNYSTFLGKPGLFLEDLFVKPHLRRKGIGLALLKKLAAIARERDYGRMEWSVLDWNDPAIQFYKKLGAVPLDEWTMFRLTGEALGNFAGR